MADEWLRADQVAAIERRHQRYPVPPGVAPYPLCDDDGQEWPCDAAALLAQDGRWRALVGELLAALAAMGYGVMDLRGADGRYLSPRFISAWEQAQAALDGGA